jgi:15-cis-phytoene synthase
VTEAQKITKSSGSNLALAFIVLPRDRREDMSVFYAFCRVVDDIADGDASSGEKKRALDLWRKAIDHPTPEEPPLADAVRGIISKYHLQSAHLHEIITGVETDIAKTRYETWTELSKYCHRVASVVGLVSIEIFGAKSPQARNYALNLGLALQLTNILRDVGQDYANGQRTYLPAEDLTRFGVTIEDIANHRRTEGFLALMTFQSERAEAFYFAAQKALPKSDQRALVAAEIMRRVYHDLLIRMKRDQFHVFEKRYRLSRATKLKHVLKGWWCSRKNEPN